MNIKEVILNAKRFNASDIHIICNDYITLRIDGELTRYSSKVVDSYNCREFCDDLIGSEETKLKKRYEKYLDEECGEIDFSRNLNFVDLENEIENNDTKDNKIIGNDINRYIKEGVKEYSFYNVELNKTKVNKEDENFFRIRVNIYRRNGGGNDINRYIKEGVKEYSFYNVELNKTKVNKEDENFFRIRVNIYRRNGGDCISIRLIPGHVKTAKELNIPDIVCNSGDLKGGIILITGATGSGKSTTLAAIIDRISKTSKKHIITLEEPIEYLHKSDKSIISQRECGHKSDKSIISQRECGKDTVDFLDGLKSSLRQDPDVIMIGEIRDKKTVETALSASETGHLVLSTVHTSKASEAIDRIVNLFEAERHKEIRGLLANQLRYVFSQRLHLVLSTVHTSKASEAIDRIVNLFEAERHKEIRGLLANQLRYVFSQRLIKANNGRRAIFEIMKNTNSIAGLLANQLRYVFSQRLIKANNGRRAIFEIMKNTNSIAAMIREGKDESIDNQLRYVFSQRLIKVNNGRRVIFEIMKNTNSIAAMIREGKDESIDDMIKTGKKYGMRMFEDQIEKLYRDGIISEEIYLDEINNR